MKIICFLLFASFPLIANAAFYIDYQGLEKSSDEKKERKELISPDGYRLLTDDLSGLVYEIGNRKEVSLISSFAQDEVFKDVVGVILPKGWSAYLDEHLSGNEKISISANDEKWLNVLARVGNDYGYKFIVDWQQEIVQITSDEHYVKPDPDEPLGLEGSDGQMYYIYKSKQSKDNGVMIIDGEVVPLKITN